MTTSRVLSIQSHVVSGYVGNKAAVFPLQLLGLDVDVINSVQFSNHTGYSKGFKGSVMDGDGLDTLLTGLDENGLLEDIQYVLTGYIGSATFLAAIRNVILRVKARTPNFRYLCDPVLGDHGKFYVPPELVDLMKSDIIPLADIVTPNQFEVEQLTGVVIHSLTDAKKASVAFHDLGPSIVFLTSLEFPTAETLGTLTIFASQRKYSKDDTSSYHDEVYAIEVPKLQGAFTGTGDLTAALILGHLHQHPDNLKLVMEKVINTMQAVILKTSEITNACKDPKSAKARELRLIQSKSIIENPSTKHEARKVE
ncbi:unnamed protein product [Cylindrotheca closterium]|uniref:pyridoxal kinase n=1 Tax=Cylindrotheca closterium TaxID=2856 RepID=A0AAD2JH34_9STRA|nr:unnamed protein product [Cylindrotheca closterium]